ncbi:hypothetical protein LK994_08905 [Ferruginibacter lapsinanis]|uniref:hypothetical protein n=1 Tax=Ferruginibacter lapsinanis TaxID=563172 RepID=UPI001E5FCFBD|nr:hypothetical protein [Ferruginibacter lapsinanis]UEG48755.1 hypothetical protein LK994_08905 [Ferruginibacter lapsinanis]
MISDKEKQFLQYWEANREAESTVVSKLLRGFPMAAMFGLPIILLVVVIKLFFPDWYMKISQTSPGMFITAIIAMILVIIFYAIFRMHYKWEMNEQLYQEIKAKQRREEKVG